MTVAKIIAVQTAAGEAYEAMLRETGKVTQLYCSRHGIEYREFVGIKRGHFPWHACFNRIVILKELIDSGYAGWVFYLDADAFVVDLEFDVRQLIAANPGVMLISPGGLTGLRWDVNDGVFLINLGSSSGRRIATLWHEDFMRTTDAELEAAPEWQMVPSDQPRLHRILRENEGLLSEVAHVPREIFNNEKASFVRQILRSNASTMEDRLETIRQQVAGIIKEHSASIKI